MRVMTRSLTCALLVVIAGCGARRRRSRRLWSSSRDDDHAEVTPSPGTFTSCPRASRRRSGRDARSAGWTDAPTSEGSCDSPPPPQCGGYPLPPPIDGASLEFECAPADPHATKADGCPHVEPGRTPRARRAAARVPTGLAAGTRASPPARGGARAKPARSPWAFRHVLVRPREPERDGAAHGPRLRSVGATSRPANSNRASVGQPSASTRRISSRSRIRRSAS
jgi:hypothetical protein